MKQTLALAWCLTSSLIIIRKSDEKTWRNISSRNDVGVARQCERMLNEKDVSITMKYESNSSQRLEHSEHCKLCTLWHVPTLAIVLMSAAAAASCFPCLEGIFVSTSARVFHVARDFFYVLSTFPALMTKRKICYRNLFTITLEVNFTDDFLFIQMLCSRFEYQIEFWSFYELSKPNRELSLHRITSPARGRLIEKFFASLE